MTRLDPSESSHSITVERRGPQRFRVVCTCGWEGVNSKGTDFWNKAGSLSAVLKHQREQGLPQGLPAYVDLEPESSRRRR